MALLKSLIAPKTATASATNLLQNAKVDNVIATNVYKRTIKDHRLVVDACIEEIVKSVEVIRAEKSD
jgi:hypothetical protein